MEQDKCFNLPPKMRNLTLGIHVYNWDYIIGRPIKYILRGRTESESNGFVPISYTLENIETKELEHTSVFYSSLDEMYEDMLPKLRRRKEEAKNIYEMHKSIYENLIKYYNKEKAKEQENKIQNLITGN
jgi:hypothetical protein